MSDHNLKINLGCGEILKEDFVNIDIHTPRKADSTFVKHDLTKGMPFCNNAADYILGEAFFEHFYPEQFMFLLNDCWRVLKPDGILQMEVPYWKADAYWRDPTHKMGFSVNSSKYWDQHHVEHYRYGFLPWHIEGVKTSPSRDKKDPISIIQWQMKPYKDAQWTTLGQTVEAHGRKVEIGCGTEKEDQYVGVDISEVSNADIIRDVTQGLPFCSGVVKEVKAHSILEHFDNDDFIQVMWEIWRILEHGGALDLIVPQAPGEIDVKDPTHKMSFSKPTFNYFKMGELRQRQYKLPPFYEVNMESKSGRIHGTMKAWKKKIDG